MNVQYRAAERAVRATAAAAALVALAACAGGSGSPAASATPSPACGNGVAEGSEECDDGNASNADGCLVTCQRPAAWVTSDVHVHSTGCSQYASPARLAELLKAQQIQVGAALVWGEGYANDAAFFTGRDHALSTPGFILHYDLEVSHFEAARGGHLVLLGLDSIAFSDDVFHVPQSGMPVVEWAHRQPRALVGMAHAQFWPADGRSWTRPAAAARPGSRRPRRARTARLPVAGAHARRGAGQLPALEGARERGSPRGDHGRQRLVVHRGPLPRAHAPHRRDRRRSAHLRELALGHQGGPHGRLRARRHPAQPSRRRPPARRGGAALAAGRA